MTGLNIGMLGTGEMGAGLAAAFAASGHTVLCDLTGRSQESCARAREAGMTQVSSLADMVAQSDIIFSVLPTQCALAAASGVAAVLANSVQQLVYVEANAIAPALAIEIAEQFLETPVQFIDGGIVGPPPRGALQPRLYAVGMGLDVLQQLDGTGFKLVAMDGSVGDASAFKMTYAAMTKGTNALLANVLLAAQSHGFLDLFVDEIEASQKVLADRARTNIPHLPCDAARWQDEMQQIARSFADIGLPADFHKGAGTIMHLLADSPFGTETRRTMDKSRSMEATLQGIANKK
jgi:3-hydroxyisobutyrate dehydrogenase-like beta-hydroxyacid dehydrogenase